MEEFLQLKQEVHEIAEKLKGSFEEHADSGEKEEKGNPSSKTYRTIGSDKKKGKGIPPWKTAPLVQINVTIFAVGDNVKQYSVILDTSPFEPNAIAQDPLLFFEINDGTLERSSDIREEAKLCKAKRQALVPWDPRPATITSASTHAWAKKSWPRATPNCACDPSYSEEGRDHSQPSMCKAWGIGGAIANRLWNNESIEGMAFEPKLLV